MSELNRQARCLLETAFPWVHVSGELSNLARPPSGHWYFTLKDSRAQVRCALFRAASQKLGFVPEEGQQVLVKARAGLYETRGDWQLTVSSMEPFGTGALQLAFEQLKRRLAAEGLLSQERKRPLPHRPGHIALVTSRQGAAVHDMLTVFRRRYPCLTITIVHTPVQGATAAASIVQALERAQQLPDVDAIIVGRGGGSLEDLWPFNEEAVARAIAHCRIPVVSGVGHEVDVTLADLVADYRAPTPSAAAELLSPDKQELLTQLDRLSQGLLNAINYQLQLRQRQLNHLRLRLRHPGALLREQQQKLDDTTTRLHNGINYQLQLRQRQLSHLRLRLRHPGALIREQQQKLDEAANRLHRAMDRALFDRKHQLDHRMAQLDAYSPLATLRRGYSITFTPAGKTVTDTRRLQPGDKVHTRLADGSFWSVVTSLDTAPEQD